MRLDFLEGSEELKDGKCFRVSANHLATENGHKDFLTARVLRNDVSGEYSSYSVDLFLSPTKMCFLGKTPRRQ